MSIPGTRSRECPIVLHSGSVHYEALRIRKVYGIITPLWRVTVDPPARTGPPLAQTHRAVPYRALKACGMGAWLGLPGPAGILHKNRRSWFHPFCISMRISPLINTWVRHSYFLKFCSKNTWWWIFWISTAFITFPWGHYFTLLPITISKSNIGSLG